MSFQQPVFNLTVNVYTFTHTFPLGAPRLQVQGNLAWGRRVSLNNFVGAEAIMTLLVPAGSPVRGPVCTSGPDYVECPAGTGRFYSVIGVDDLGKGFPNEHRGVLLLATRDNGTWPDLIP